MSPRPVALLLALLLAGGAAGCGKPADSPAAAVAVQKAAAPAGERAQEQAQKQDAEPALCQHRVPSDLCTRCNPDLIDVFKEEGDWCQEHAVPESQCFQCNPDLSFAANPETPKDWCKEHSVPESKCTKCSPERIAAFIEADNYCREHGFPEDVCPFCHPELVRAAGQIPPAEAPLGSKVRLASAGTVSEAGIRTEKVQKRPFARSLEVVGQLSFDQNKLAQLAARGDALIVEVKADLGDEVAAGESLIVLASAAVGEEQAQLSSARAQVAAARANVERETRLTKRGISPRRSLEEAQTELARAQAELDAARSSLGASGASASETGGRYSLSSPFAGIVVSRDAVAGRSAGSGQLLMQISDLSRLWALLDVPEADAGEVRAGQKVSLYFDRSGEADEKPPLETRVSRVASSVNPATRSVQVRVEVDNPEARLKAGAFVRARIAVGDEHEALLVPRDAVQKAEGRKVVFVKKGDSLFQPVTVQLGSAGPDEVEVTEGLKDGDEIVTTGAFLLKTEILKDSIGAGCCEEDE